MIIGGNPRSVSKMARFAGMGGQHLFDLTPAETNPLPGCQAEDHPSQLREQTTSGRGSRNGIGGPREFVEQPYLVASISPRRHKEIPGGQGSSTADPRIASPILPPIDRG